MQHSRRKSIRKMRKCVYNKEHVWLPDRHRDIKKRKRSDSVLWQKPLHQQKCQKGKGTTKKFDYIAVADRLRTISWSNHCHPICVVNRFTGPTFQLPAMLQPCNMLETLNSKHIIFEVYFWPLYIHVEMTEDVQIGRSNWRIPSSILVTFDIVSTLSKQLSPPMKNDEKRGR